MVGILIPADESLIGIASQGRVENVTIPNVLNAF